MSAELALFKDHLFKSPEEKNAEIFKFSEPYLAKKNIILDIGCGNGSYLAYLDTKKEQIKAVGIDISRVNIETAKNRFTSSDLEFLRGDYFKTSFGRKFEVLVSNSSLQYQKVNIKKLSDDLLDGGFLILYTPYESFSNRLKNIFRIFMNFLPRTLTDPAILFLMKLVYGNRWDESDLKNRLVYLRARIYFFIGQNEIAEFKQNGLNLEKALYFKKTSSFWQMRHGFFVFKKRS